MTKRLFIVDEEKHYSDLVSGCARVKGYEPVQFFDASSALYYFQSNRLELKSDLLWIDMYLLPGTETVFHPKRRMYDEYRVGLKLAERLVDEKILSRRENPRVCLYTGHSTEQLWKEIDEFCADYGFSKFRKKGTDQVEDILGRIVE